MKRVVFFLVIVSILMQGCVFSETERGALTEIAESYGGKITIAKGTSTSGKYYEVTLSETSTPLQLDRSMEIAAHNISMMVYKSMDTINRNTYDEIRIVLNTGDIEISRTVSVALAKILVEGVEKNRKHADEIKLGQFESFYTQMDTGIRNTYPLDSFLLLTDKVFSRSGAVEAAYPIGVDTVLLDDIVYARYIDIYRAIDDTLSDVLITRVYKLNEMDSVYGFTFDLRKRE